MPRFGLCKVETNLTLTLSLAIQITEYIAVFMHSYPMQQATISKPSTALAIAEQIANILENQFRFGKWGFGLDSIIDLLPVGGDIIVLLLSLSLLVLGARMKLPKSELLKMVINIAIAFAVGLIPVLGDAAYLAFRPNMRNLEILRRHELG